MQSEKKREGKKESLDHHPEKKRKDPAKPVMG